MKGILNRIKKFYEEISLRNIIWASFTATALAAVVVMGVSFNNRMSSQFKRNIQEENQNLIEQVNNRLASYLRNTMKVSDSLYYSVIKNSNMLNDSMTSQFQLLYDTNKDIIESIAVFSLDGDLLESAPASSRKNGVDVAGQEWFKLAQERPENLHFSGPSVQNLFIGKDEQYSWVISLSRVVALNYGVRSRPGILLVDLRYSGLEEIFNSASLGNDGYIYLIGADGQILYHPKLQLISSGLAHENNLEAAGYRDGNYEEAFEGVKRTVTVKSVGYTGWKIVGVTPQKGLALSNIKSNIFFAFLVLFLFTVLVLINSYISAMVSKPIRVIEESVKQIDAGNLDVTFDSGGYFEVRRLAGAMQKMTLRIKQLMRDIVTEHESKRRGELDTLQSQINPHFLYNTLDIIVWMIENERKGEAVRAVTALARFFRISLSRGRTIIPVRDELAHVDSYLMIQNMRYKNKFTYAIEADENTKDLAAMKLVLQPLVENAIYHGMEYMDGDGEIRITAGIEGSDLLLSVSDNGPGMPPEVAVGILEREFVPSGKGSGIGVRNVNERIRLQFGEGYGLMIESNPDEGTAVTIRLPAIPYGEMEAKA